MLAEAKIAIETVTGAIALFDKLYPRIVQIIQGREPRPPSIKIERAGEEIVATSDGGTPLKRVTYNELVQKLPPEGIKHIRMFEQSMQNYSDQIESVYPQLALLPPIEKAQTQARLRQMTVNIKADLLGILDFIKKLGFDLDDHYGVAWNLVNQLGQK